jgi:hypothetical protein
MVYLMVLLYLLACKKRGFLKIWSLHMGGHRKCAYEALLQTVPNCITLNQTMQSNLGLHHQIVM